MLATVQVRFQQGQLSNFAPLRRMQADITGVDITWTLQAKHR